MFRTTAAALAVSAVLSLPAAAGTVADVFSSFWVFGDSLSDTGNLSAQFGGAFPPPPYFNGMFSNGPVWNAGFLDDFAPGSSGNFAYAAANGATNQDQIPDFAAQLALFSAAPKTLGSRPLASVLFGANDMFAAVSSAAADPANGNAIVASAIGTTIASLSAGIAQLVQAGITDFALFNLPDLGTTPRLRSAGAQAQALGSAVTASFNGAIAALSAGLKAQNLGVYDVDLAALINNAIADPAAFGLTNVSDACLPVDPFSILSGTPVPQACATPNQYLYWDALHPSATGHLAIAATFDAAVPAAPVPLPAGVLLLGTALAALGLGRRFA